jgi:hypothetical protein
MSKLKGSYKSANNIEVITSHPLDPRVRWDSWSSLKNINDWPKNDAGKPYLYGGLIVSVNEGTQNSPDWVVYVLNDINNWNIEYGRENSGWKRMTDDFHLYWEDETGQ